MSIFTLNALPPIGFCIFHTFPISCRFFLFLIIRSSLLLHSRLSCYFLLFEMSKSNSYESRILFTFSSQYVISFVPLSTLHFDDLVNYESSRSIWSPFGFLISLSTYSRLNLWNMNSIVLIDSELLSYTWLAIGSFSYHALRSQKYTPQRIIFLFNFPVLYRIPHFTEPKLRCTVLVPVRNEILVLLVRFS